MGFLVVNSGETRSIPKDKVKPQSRLNKKRDFPLGAARWILIQCRQIFLLPGYAVNAKAFALRIIFGLMLAILPLVPASVQADEGNAISGKVQHDENGPYNAEELKSLDKLYRTMSREQVEKMRKALTKRQLELNTQLNLAQFSKSESEIRNKITRIHQELETIDKIEKKQTDFSFLWARYQKHFFLVTALIVLFILLGVLDRALQNRQRNKLAAGSRMPTEPNPTDTSSSVEPSISQGAEYRPKVLTTTQEGPIPIQDIQSHVDYMLLQNPDSYNAFLDFIFRQAIYWKASDIHFQRSGTWFEVRFRLDGQLTNICVLDPYREREILNIVKVMARLKIYESQRVQEGRLELQINQHWYEFRVSVVPALDTEKIVVRIFGDEELPFDLDRLGHSLETNESIKETLHHHTGLILFVGPAGSGKTTTMYSCLNYLKNMVGGINISSLEDPVEASLSGITQVQINPSKGVNFDSGFSNLLRQDSDVIMIGEIRDSITAKLAIRAAHSGHLIISTVHSATTLGAVNRMLDLTDDAYGLHIGLAAVLSQRLVKQVCVRCMTPYTPDPALLAKIQPYIGAIEIEWRRGKGCEICHGRGYRGRIMLDEMLSIPLGKREQIAALPGRNERRDIMAALINHSLLEDGIRKAAAGLTTIEEVMNAVGELNNQ